MSSGRPYHYPPHKVNKKPSDDEPIKSYEKTSEYLDDDVYLSVQEEFHKEHGNLYLLKPPKTHGHAAAAAPASAVDTLDGDVGQAKGGGISILIPPVKTATAGKTASRSLLHRNISSFDDAAGLDAKSTPGGNVPDDDALSRSPGSCPSFTNVARANKHTVRGESFASAVTSSTLTEEDEIGGGDDHRYDQAAFMQKWPSETIPTRNRGKNKKKSNDSYSSLDNVIVEEDADAGSRSSPKPSPRTAAKKVAAEKAAERRQAKAKESDERKKHSKFLSKKRARLRDMRHNEVFGSSEFGHDSTLSSQDDDDVFLSSRTASQLSLDNNRSPSTIGGRRKQRIESELGKASVTKRLMLRGLNLRARELPISSILSFPLGSDLTKLCLAGNDLNCLPDILVHKLEGLRTMDLQQCGLVTLPDNWDLPNLRRLNLSHNHLRKFLSEDAIQGLPSLERLSMSNNDIYDFSLPDSGPMFENLEYLSLAFNNISLLPEGLPRLIKLRELRLSNNYITHVPQAVCHMELSDLDVTPNPLIQPPLGDCDQGVGAMRRYYAGLQYRERRRSRLGDESMSSPRPRRMKAQPSPRRLVSAPSPSMGAQRRFHGTSATTPAMNLRGGGMPRVATVPLQASTMPLHVVPPVAAFAITEPRHGAQEECDIALDDVEMGPSSSENSVTEPYSVPESAPSVINDTLKIVFVGNSRSGKTTSMNRLKKGMLATIPKKEESTIGISIDSWDPKSDCKKFGIDASHLDTTIIQEDYPAGFRAADADIKFSLWDFAGQDVYHATHSIFFSPSALYILMWDMGWNNKAARKVVEPADELEDGPFQWLDSDDEDDDERDRRAQQVADRALDEDIDNKVAYWIDCIRASVPGAAILPVATHDDCFNDIGGPDEAMRRCRRMKERILRKEHRRVESLRKRLIKLENEHRANAPAATRIRELLSQYRLPKIIFDDDDDSSDPVIRVSGKYDTRFGVLRERIVNLAAGRDTSCTNFRSIVSLASGKKAREEDYRYPLFRGHVGSIIPPFRLKIRELVREKRLNYQVVEWNLFVSMVEKSLGYRPPDAHLNDALRFLSRIGEISFFGEMQGLEERPHIAGSRFTDDIFYDTSDDEEDDDDDDYTPGPPSLQLETIAPDVPAQNSPPGSQTKLSGLSQFIFINPLWLAVTLRCVLRHDLKQQLEETLSKTSTPSRWSNLGRADSFHDSASRCPILRPSDARALWESHGKLAKSAKKAIQDDANSKKSAFSFMEGLLVHFGVFVPISLSTGQVLIDGEVYSRPNRAQVPSSPFYFLPSQLQAREGPTEDAWTYKTNDATKVCLCQTWLFRDGAPPSLMERLTSSVLRRLYSATTSCDTRGTKGNGQLSFKRILCWKGAFKISLAKFYVDVDGYLSQTIVDIWAQLEDQSSPSCVGGESTGAGLKRLIISAKGYEANGTQNIWEGGYAIVLDEADRVIREYRGLDFSRQPACPTCLDTKEVRQAALWFWSNVRDSIQSKDRDMCCSNGHDVDIRYLAGKQHSHRHTIYQDQTSFSVNGIVPYTDLCPGVVLVGLWDGEKVVRTGSGFVVDAKHGLIVSAAHNAINIMAGAFEPSGTLKRSQSKYYGLEEGRILIGVITTDTNKGDNPNSPVGPEISWRYFGEIAAEDICNMDAVVLRIKGRLRNDVDDVNDVYAQPVESLETKADFENEALHQLKVTTKADLQEPVRLIGYPQGGDGLLPPGHSINRSIEVAQGHVAGKRRTPGDLHGYRQVLGHHPRLHIVVNTFCLTICGQSGSPCVNQAGEVIGILSRADPADKQRCYLCPTRE